MGRKIRRGGGVSKMALRRPRLMPDKHIKKMMTRAPPKGKEQVLVRNDKVSARVKEGWKVVEKRSDLTLIER